MNRKLGSSSAQTMLVLGVLDCSIGYMHRMGLQQQLPLTAVFPELQWSVK